MFSQWKSSVKTKNYDKILLGPKADYKPQTDDFSEKSKVEVNNKISVCLKDYYVHITLLQPMNVTKALTCLGLVTGRGMDNGQQVQRAKGPYIVILPSFR